MSYILTYHNNMIENKDARSIKVLPNDNFTVGVLDTKFMVEKHYSRKELEAILTKYPNIEIEGIKHSNGIIKELYVFRENYRFLQERDFAVLWEEEIELHQGSYLDVHIYTPKKKYHWRTSSAWLYHWDMVLQSKETVGDKLMLCFHVNLKDSKGGLYNSGHYIVEIDMKKECIIRCEFQGSTPQIYHPSYNRKGK